MEPRIKVGDVVLASPNHDPKTLLGHVTVFDDPALPGQVKSHRVIAVNPDGTMTTKGDANPTADPVPVRAGPGARHRPAAGPLGRAAAGLGDDRSVPLPRPVPARRCSAAALGRGPRPRGRRGRRGRPGRRRRRREPTDGRRREPAPQAAGCPGSRRRRGPRTRLERRARRRRTRAGLGHASAWSAPARCSCPAPRPRSARRRRPPASSWTVPSYSYPTAANSYGPVPVLEARRHRRHRRRRVGQRPDRHLRGHLHPQRDRRHAGHRRPTPP